MVGGDQIPLDVSVERRLAIWIFLRRIEYLQGASLAQEIANQYAARAIDERIERQTILPLVFYDLYRSPRARGAQVAIVEPERLDRIAKLRSCLSEQHLQEVVNRVFVCVRRRVLAFRFLFHDLDLVSAG